MDLLKTVLKAVVDKTKIDPLVSPPLHLLPVCCPCFCCMCWSPPPLTLASALPPHGAAAACA